MNYTVMGAVAATVVYLVFLVFIPLRQTASLKKDPHQDQKDILELTDKCRGTIAQIAGGILLIFTICVTLYSIQSTAATAEKSLLADRYGKGVELLGTPADNASISKKIGGIYLLERVAKESGDYHWSIVQVLTAYVRAKVPADGKAPGKTLPTEVQTILTVLGRRTIGSDHPEPGKIDLHATDLRGADFRSGHFEGTNLQGALLGVVPGTQDPQEYRETRFDGAYLNGASFQNAHLDKVHFDNASLQDASLFNANEAQSASFSGAHAEGADFRLTGLKRETLQKTGATISLRTQISP